MMTYNNTTQTLTLPSTLLQPVISSKQVTFKTPEEWAVWYYEDLILSIMKAIDLQYVTHCTDNEYRLIMLHEVDDILIHIKQSSNLTKHLLKQKDKSKSIKTRVNQIYQALLLPNRVNHHMTSNLIKGWSMKTGGIEDKKEDKKVQKEIWIMTIKKTDKEDT